MVPSSPTRRRRKEATNSTNLAVDPANSNSVPLGSSPARPEANGKSSSSSRHRHDKKRSRRKHVEDTSFGVLVIQVGTVLACLVVIVYGSYRAFFAAYRNVYPEPPLPDTADFDDDAISSIDNNAQPNDIIASEQQQQQQQQRNDPELDKLLEEAALELQKEEEERQLQQQKAATLPPPRAIPTLNVSEWASRTDAYGMTELFSRQAPVDVTTGDHTPDKNNSHQDLATFWRAAQALREQFAERYGGENAARYIMEQGLDRFIGNATTWKLDTVDQASLPASLRHTACRIRHAQTNQRPFRFMFGGYSVTNGRGNYFSQSYPFVMEQLLHTPFYLLGLQLKVANHAIGGCPSFPYGWCLREFMGDEADVISWDFSMNEAGGDPTGLEAYVRQVLTQLPQRPQLIVKDTPMATQRRRVLDAYKHLLHDPLLLVSDAAADYFLEHLDVAQRPNGFLEWRKFGAPLGAPGQVVHHPGVKEHEFIAWILAMHFLSILELVAGLRDTLQCPVHENGGPLTLPRPLAEEATHANLTKPWTGVLFGHATRDDSDAEWSVNRIRCRTTFEPIVQGDLSELIVLGSVAENVNVMLPKSNMYYNRGWVLDMSDSEKKAKRKLELFGGLGFIDGKKAYYGLYTSKALRLLLPFDGELSTEAGSSALKSFRSVVVCEVNEKRDFGACDLSQDVTFTIGGVNATATPVDKAAFMGKKICVYLPVPNAAVLSTRSLIKQQYAHPHGLMPPEETEEERAKDAVVGLEVQIRVVNTHIMSHDKACSVSHVIWEQAAI